MAKLAASAELASPKATCRQGKRSNRETDRTATRKARIVPRHDPIDVRLQRREWMQASTVYCVSAVVPHPCVQYCAFVSHPRRPAYVIMLPCPTTQLDLNMGPCIQCTQPRTCTQTHVCCMHRGLHPRYKAADSTDSSPRSKAAAEAL